jgi:hypothetical protein
MGFFYLAGVKPDKNEINEERFCRREQVEWSDLKGGCWKFKEIRVRV